MLPLEGIRILDLTIALAGPAATQRLAEWGAEVIKVEPPHGEMTRTHPIVNGWLGGETTVFLSLNRSKRSVVLDLKSEDGLADLLRLVATSDVFVHNFRPGVADRLGISSAALRAINPRIVYASVSGYGHDGPDARRPGQDLLLQAYSGTLFSSGSAGDPPTPGPIFVADVLTSHLLAQGILVALIDRDRNGIAQDVEVSMLGSMLDAQAQELVTFLNLGIAPERGRQRRAHAFLNPPYSIFSTADGWIAIAMAEPAALGSALQSEELVAIGDWASAADRADEVVELVARALPARTTAEWIDVLDTAGVWCGPVHQYDDLSANPQIEQCGYFMDVPLAGGGTHRAPGRALTFSAHPDLRIEAPPRLGQHNSDYSIQTPPQAL